MWFYAEGNLLHAVPGSRPAQRRRSRPLVYTAFSALLLAVATGAFLLVHALLGNDNNLIKPPVVIGLSQVDATNQLSAAGLRVDKITAVFNLKAVGTVEETG